MELLTQLGLNETFGLQLCMFLVVFVVLRYCLFAPYYAAYNERKARTLGKTELAERFIAESIKLEEEYGKRAQQANDKFREIFDKSRGEAMKEYDRLLSDARGKAKTLIEDSRRKIGKEMETSRGQLSQEVGGVSQLIINKLIGRDLSI